VAGAGAAANDALVRRIAKHAHDLYSTAEWRPTDWSFVREANADGFTRQQQQQWL
jgi:hypothetical protein